MDVVPGPPRESRVLRPGVRVARRHDGRLQVGLGRQRVLVPDTPGVRRRLAALDAADRSPEGAPGPEHATGDVGTDEPPLPLDHLLVDRDDLALVRHPDPAVAGGRAGVLAERGPLAGRVLDARREARVRVSGPAPWRDRAAELLGLAGVGTAGEDGPADLHLLVHVAEPSGTVQDALLRSDAVHLWAGAVAGRVRVGPFVEPGRTACRRCVAAHRCDREPGWALVRAQYAGTDPRLPEPCDPVLMSLATAWAVRDVVAWLDGLQPSTWSATVDVDPALRVDRRPWTRHPACGCSWTGAWRAG